MILDSDRFIQKERPHWEDLSRRLEAMENQAAGAATPEALLELHGLYRRAASGLARLQSAAADPGVIAGVESLVGRAYAEIHSRHQRHSWKAAGRWLASGFPLAFRRQFRYFAIALWITLAGCLVGAVAIAADRGNREVIFPFSHLAQSPSERVAKEEAGDQHDDARHSTFAAQLMQNNIRVTINVFALGMLYGIGTVIMLFYNGVVLGGVCFDYAADGQTVFLLGWLLPHGVIELPAVFIGGQAGLLLARALFGFGNRLGLRGRLRLVLPDLAALVYGAAVLLVWAGIVESFLSQYHQPVLPYAAKIAFGLVELGLLVFWLGTAGRPESVSPAA